MSKITGHNHRDSSILHGTRFVSLLPAFTSFTRAPAFLESVRRRASGRPLPRNACTPLIRVLALDLVSAMWSTLLDVCDAGIEIRDGDGVRELRVFGFLRYRISADRKWVRAWIAGDCGDRPENVEVGSPLPSWRWVATALQSHRCRLLEPFAALPTARDAGMDAIWDWAVASVQGLARRHIDWRTMRVRLREAFDLDPGLLALARRARPEPFNDVTSDWYSTCGDFRHHLERVADKAPSMLRALGLLIRRHELNQRDAPLATLKRHFEHLGAKPQEWRSLLKDCGRPVWRMPNGWRPEGSLDFLRMMLVWTRLHRGLAAGDRLPHAMWETILRTCAGPMGENVSPLLKWRLQPRLVQAAIQRARAMAAAGRFDEFLQAEWTRVVAWIADYRDEGIHPTQRAWKSALRGASDAERSVRAWARGCDICSWESRVEEFESRGLRARALTTPSAVIEEAISMRHCADSHLIACSTGKVRLFRVDDMATGKHVATIALRSDQHLGPAPSWELDQARGFANQPPSAAVLDLGNILARE